MIKDVILNNLKKALNKIGVKDVEVTLDRPTNSTYGDFATSIALKLTKELKKNPLLIAQEIVKNLPKSPEIKKVEVIKPGFINFWINEKLFFEELKKIQENKDKYGTNNNLRKKRITVEFTDPNPFKEFHIGHLYSNIVGESLSRIWEANGAIVRRVNYQGDVGLHVAKSLWGLQKKMLEDKLTVSDLNKKSLSEKIKYLGQCYAFGATKYEENDDAKNEIIKINRMVYDRDSSIENLYQQGRKWSLEYFESIYKRLGTKFEEYYFERDVGEVGLKIVKENLKKGTFLESKGAVIFPGEKYGQHSRVFINSLGLPTYEAKELGLAPTKYNDWQYDESYIITGNEINAYFKVLIAAMKQVFPDLGNKTHHIGHGMVKLPEGKMSSRTGKIITGEWLLNESVNKAQQIIKKASQLNNITPSTSEEIGVSAIKYALLKQGIGQDVEFDFNESISFDGNSGPYLQYMYVRCQSILNKTEIHSNEINFDIKLAEEESALLRLFVNFSSAIADAVKSFSPHLIANYLFELAQAFSLFYEKCPILKGPSEKKGFRLLLTKSTAQVLKNGLNLLGIKTVEKM